MTLADAAKVGEKAQRWVDEDVDLTATGSVGEDLVVELKLSPDECQEELQFTLLRGDGPMPSDRYQIQTRGNVVQLTLKQSQKEDAGHYALVARKLSTGLSIPGDEKLESRRKIRLSIKDPSQGSDEGEPPIFVRRLSDLAVKVGTRTRFLVEIRSSTSPKVTWHKNDEPVQEGSRFSFVHEGNFYCVDVAPVMVDDQGNWTCMAENGGGRSSCTSFLNVIVPKAYKKPEFVEELRALLTETGTVSLECKVVGVPTPVLKWFKDQKEIKAGDVFALTANPDDPTSLGTYTCEAVNCMGTACSSSRVHVVGKGSREGSLKPADALAPSGPLPVFKKILRDESCKIGDSLVLSCQVLVPPWPKAIAWYNKEGRIEPNEKYRVIEDGLGGYSIEIKGVEAMDEGEWKCVATSPENMKQFSTCYVAMSIPKNYRMPRFMESLKAVLTEEGLVSFECKVVGFPTPLLRWFKDGQELHPGDVYQLTGTNSLGSYCCIARNCMGEAKSIAELTVEDIQNQLNEEERMQLMSTNQAPKFVKGLRSCEARINEDFTFTIQVSVSPEPSLSWYRDDVPVIESEKYRLAREALGTCHLEVKKLEFMDQAEWKCVAANDFGHSVTSCFLKLAIPKHFKKPKFLESLRAILSEEGAVNLECKVIGVPQPVLKWYKDGVELKPGDIHRIISGQDGTCCLGTYTCEATNCMGSVSSSASLLGFEDRVSVRKEEAKETPALHELARNLSLSTIHEERTSQLYDTPQTDHSVTLDDRGEVSFSFDGKEVSVSLYETPDLTEEEALQIVEMYADQLSEHITEGNIIELPPMRFTKETSTTGNLLMEAVVIDVSPDYFVPDDGDDLRTEADVEDVSIMDDQMQSLRSLSCVSSPSAEMPNDRVPSGSPPSRPPRRKESRESASSKSERSEKSLPKGFDWSESYHSAKEPSVQAQSSLQGQDDSGEAFTDALSSSGAGRSKAEESRDLYASFVEQTLERIPLDEIQVEATTAAMQIGEALVEELPVKKKKRKKIGKSSRTPSLSSKASSEESYSVEAEEVNKRRGSKSGREKSERRGSASSNKGIGKTLQTGNSSESVKFESAATTDRRRRESDATIMVDDIQIEQTEEIMPIDVRNEIEATHAREETDFIAEERPASAISAASTADSEKTMSKTNKERLLENIYKLTEPIMTLRSALVDLDNLLPLLQAQGNAADVERSQMEIAERIVAPVENLCEQVSVIETKALKSAGDRSLAQNVRISLLEAIGGPTEELLRGIELIRRQDNYQQDPKSSLIVLESLTDPVDEILLGLTKIERDLTTPESAESSLIRLEKPIALERMFRAVSRLGTNVEGITQRNFVFGEDESTGISVIERLQSAYQSLEAFLSTVPLSEVSGTLENNVDTLVVETLVRPLEELSRSLDVFSTADVRTQIEQDSVVSGLEKSISEMSTRLEALTAALEIYEQESGERGITELHADLVTFLRYTMDDAVERLEKLKLKKQRVTQETRVTPMVFHGKSSQDGDESVVESSETEEARLFLEGAEDAASNAKKFSAPSTSEPEISASPLLHKKSTKLGELEEQSSTQDEEGLPSLKKDVKQKKKPIEKSVEEKKQARTPPELDVELPLPEMLLDPLIDVQANLSDVISDFESQESAEESSLPGGSELAACLTELRECVANAAHTATTLKSANTVNALVDMREPLLDLQLAMASAASPEEIKLIREATVPLAELKVIVAAAIRSPQTPEASQAQMKPVLRMLEDIEAEVSKVSEREATKTLTSVEASPEQPEVAETRSVLQRPPEEVERAAVALTGVHFALSTALERVSAFAIETAEGMSLQGSQELPVTVRQMAEQSAASNLIAGIEELRQCVGTLAVAIGTPVPMTQGNEQYNYDRLFDELSKLEEPLLNLQKVLLTEQHGPEDRHVLNDVASPIRSLKDVVQDVTREVGGGSTPIVLELIEDVEKDVSLIAMEALKKALAGKVESSEDDGRASVSSYTKPGEVPAIISKWLDPIEDWLTSTAEEGAESGELRVESTIAPVVDDLKRELLKIAIQTSYSEPPSDVALIEALTELQEPLAKVCRVITECHEPENLDIVEGLIQPTKHLLGTIFDASLTHEAGKVLRPVLEAVEELENQIPLTIKRATYERELQRVVKSMTPEETHAAEEFHGASEKIQNATIAESLQSLNIAAASTEISSFQKENALNLVPEDSQKLEAKADQLTSEKHGEEIATASEVASSDKLRIKQEKSEHQLASASTEEAMEENTELLSHDDSESVQTKADQIMTEGSAGAIAKASAVAVKQAESKHQSEAASLEEAIEENAELLSEEDSKSLQAQAQVSVAGKSTEQISEVSKIATEQEKSSLQKMDIQFNSEDKPKMLHAEIGTSKTGESAPVEVPEPKPEHSIPSETVEVITVDKRPFSETVTPLESQQSSSAESALDSTRADQLDLWTLTLLAPLDRLGNAVLTLDRSIDEEAHGLLCRPLDSLHKQIEIAESQFNRPAGQSLENDVETIIEGFLSPVNQLHSALESAITVWQSGEHPRPVVGELLVTIADSSTELCEQLDALRNKLIVQRAQQSLQGQQEDASLVETINAVLSPLENVRDLIERTLKSEKFLESFKKERREDSAVEENRHGVATAAAIVEEVREGEEMTEESADSALTLQKAESREEEALARASVSKNESLAVVSRSEETLDEEGLGVLIDQEATTPQQKAQSLHGEELARASISKNESLVAVSRSEETSDEGKLGVLMEHEATTTQQKAQSLKEEELARASVSKSESLPAVSKSEDDSIIEQSQQGVLKSVSTVEEIHEAERITEGKEGKSEEAQISEENNLARASVAKSKTQVAASESEETLNTEEIGVLVGHNAKMATQETAEEIVEEGTEEQASISKTDVAKISRRGSKGKEESLDIEESTAKPLEELIEAIVDSSGPRHVSSSPEGYQSITPDVSEDDKSDTLVEDKIIPPKDLAKKEPAEESVGEIGIEEKKKDGAEEMLVKTDTDAARTEKVQPNIPEDKTSAAISDQVVQEQDRDKGKAIAESKSAQEESLRQAEAALDDFAEEKLGEVLITDDLQRETTLQITQETLATAEERKKKDLMLETSKDTQEDVLGEDVEAIEPQRLHEGKAELREGESLAKAGISKAPETRVKAKDIEISEASSQESLQEISAQELEKQRGEIREADSMARAKITDAPETRIKAKDVEISEASSQESLQEISAQELEKRKGEIRDVESLAEAEVTKPPETRIKANDVEISEASSQESLQEISAQETKKQTAELREAESLAEAKIAEVPQTRLKAKDAEISETSDQESLQEISTEELETLRGELREGESLAKAKITEAPEMRITAREAELSEAAADESLQEMSMEQIGNQKGELCEAEGLAKVTIADAPETRIKAKEAELSEASTDESLHEIPSEKLGTLKGELCEGESLAKAKITDAPETLIKAKDAEISETSEQESLQEISTEKLEKQKAELRESESLSNVNVTGAPKTLKAGAAQSSETSESAESVQEISKEEFELQLQKASTSLEDSRHTAEIATIKAAEVAKLESEEVIKAANSTIVEIVETPTQKTFKVQKEGTTGGKPEDIIEKTVLKPVEDIVAMEDRQIVEIVETPAEKVIKVKVAVAQSDGGVDEVIEEIVVKKPVEGWAKSSVEEEQLAVPVSAAKIEEFVSAKTSDVGVESGISQQQHSVNKESEDGSTRVSENVVDKERGSQKGTRDALEKREEEDEKLEREKLEQQEIAKREAERLQQEEADHLERKEAERQEADQAKRKEVERLEREEDEKLKREEAERLKREEEERLKLEEAERLKREKDERLKREEAEHLKQEQEERLKREEAERLKQEEEERLKREEAERLNREKEEILRREEAERLTKEADEKLKREEAERLKREEDDRLKREEAERLKQDQEERLQREEAERLKREEDEKLKREEAERLKKEEYEKLKREEAERLKREEEERLKREEAERVKREQEEELKREEAERSKREEEERLKREEAELVKREEEERLKREEAERVRREQEEELEREEAERSKREEEERLKREEAELVKREEEERLKREEAELVKREEEERLKREEAERVKREQEEELKREEAERLKREEEERLKREEAERVKREQEEELKRKEAERLKGEEEERLKREEAERVKREKEEELKREEAERLKREEEEGLKRKEAERLQREEEEKLKREEAERLKREEDERLKREEAERLKREQEERLKREEAERVKREEEEELKREEAERLKREEEERLKREEAERLQREEEERLKREEAERLKREEDERLKREEAEQLKREEEEKLKREEAEQLKREEEEKLKREEADRFKKEEAERLKKEELDRQKKEDEKLKQEELDRAKEQEEERLKKEEAERLEKEELERQKKEAEQLKLEELDRAKKQEEERMKKEEAEKQEKEQLEMQKQAEEENKRLHKEETERLKQEELEHKKQEELEAAKKAENDKLKKEEDERLEKEAAERKAQDAEKKKEELKRAKKERKRSSLKEAERLKNEAAEREKAENDDRLKKEEIEHLETEKLQREKEEAERLKTEELERQQKEVSERLKEEEQEHRRREEVERIEKEEHQLAQEAEAERLRNKKELKRQQKDETKRSKKEDSKEEIQRRSRKSQKEAIVPKSEETVQVHTVSSTSHDDDDVDEKTPVNSEAETREKLNQRHVRVQEETQMDREPRSSSTIRTDSEMDSEHSESSKSVISREAAAPPVRRRRSAHREAIEDNTEASKERSDRCRTDRSAIDHRTRDETLSTGEEKHYIPHYSATSRFQEFAPGPRDRGKKPSFCTKLTDRTAAEASRIKLTCTVLGEPEPYVYWTKDGRELPHSSNRHCTTEENGMVSLELYAASPKDSGEYSCVAKNVHGQAHTEAKLKVYAGYEPLPAVPTFTRSIKDTYHSAENELVLECRVRGQPSPKITWLKDGQVLQIGDRYQQCDLGDGICRLKISNPDFYDGGLYTCRAENESKMSDRTSHVVNFEGKGREGSSGWRGSYRNLTSSDRDTGRPRFSSYLTDHSVPVGGTIALQVEVKGVPPPDITWMRGDRREPIPAYKARTFADSGVYTLIVPEATESETGTYVCRASNAYGYVDTAANIEVVTSGSIEGGKPAMFVSRPAETMIHVTVGEDVSVSFRANGVPKPRIVWMKGLRDITNGPRSYKESHDDYVRLTLKRALVSDEGTYCILAKNRYGCDRTFYTVKVKQRARSLTPSPDWGSVDTDNLLANIHDTERSYLKQVPGAIASEPVVVDGGRNWLALSWGKAVQHGPAPVVAYRVDAWLLGGEGGARWAELGITPVNAFDAFNLRPGGEYKFRVTPRNRYGWGDSVTMTNSVTVRDIVKFPEFSKILPGQLKALRGETLHLECEVRSESKAEVKWYRDTTDVDGIKDPRYMSYYNGSRSTLTVQAIKENDSGRYVCEATNPAGRVSTFARVQVVTDPKIVEADEKLRRMRTLEPNNEERPPEFTMRLRDRRVQMTYPVRLTCQVSGHPEPEVTWFKNREEIFQDANVSFWDDESHFHTLEISHSSLEDSGIYMAKARNVNGSVSCRCHLVVDKGIRAYVAPEFFRHLDAVYTVKYGGELRMTAQIEAYPTVGIVWHRDGHRLRPSRSAVMTLNHDGSVELSLANVTPRDAGLYCCTATNEVGRAESTTRVTVLGAAEDDPPSLTQSSLPEVVESLDVPYSKEPLFVTKPLSTEAVEGDTVIIICEVVGDPKPEVIWLRDFLRPDYYRDAAHFRRVGAGPQYRLEIPYAKLDFTGAYSVIAKNCHGEAKAVISLQIYARGQGKADSGMEQATIKRGNVQTLPSIKRPLRDLRCCDGDAVTLVCKVHATPEPDVRWEKSGKLVPLGEDFAADFDGETARLSIQHVYPEDEGEYTCVVYNDLGKAFTSACLIVDVPEGKESALSRRLTRPVGLLSAESTPISTPRSTPVRSLSPACVTSRRELKPAVRTARGQPIGRRPRLPTGPKFYAVPHNRVAEEGETVRFQCAVAGHPAPWVTWDKDGIPVTPTARISLKEKDDVRILEITEVTHEDAGLYRITLENDVGRTEATARLEIIKGRHSSLTRTIRTRSASPRTYSIYSRSPITSAVRGDTHLRPNIHDSMSGRGGTLSPTLPRWHHRNGKPPQESPEPTRRTNNKQQSIAVKSQLKNGVNSAPKPKNNPKVLLSLKPRSSSVPRENCQRFLEKKTPVHPANAKHLTKTSPSPRGTNSDEKPRSNKNSTTPTITKTTNGSMIPKRLPINRSRSPKLIAIKNSSENPQKSEDITNSDKKAATILNVATEKSREEVEQVPREKKGMPEPEVLKTLEDEFSKMKSQEKGESSPSKKINQEILAESSGVIELSENRIEKPCPPVILAAPADVIALRGAKVMLLATFKGEPQPRVRWLRKGRDVRNDDRAEIETSRGLTCLTLERVTTEQAGKYAVTLENNYGRDCRYVNVTVEGVPDPPAGTPCVQSITRAGKAIVTWRSPPYDGGCAVTGYSVEMKRGEEPCWTAVAEARHSLSHTVTGLDPEETYRFRVRAENAHGVSEPSTVSEQVTVPGENDEEIGGQVFVAEINQIEIEEEEEEFEPAFEARVVTPEDGRLFEERYDVLEELGKGRYGVVRRIIEKSSGLNLAAKFVRTIKAKDRQQVLEEIGIMNMLRHPKLLRLAAAYESPKEMIMVTEYISGGELFERVVADDFTLTEKDSIQFVKQICEGVEYMHAHSVVHLDLKPENIMCHTRTSHRIKLIDFGLAQTLKPDTPVRVLFGTPEFIPPEIIGFEPIGTESDMWSVGVICYVLLTGLSPFMGDNDAETFANITRADYDFDDKAFTAISQEAKDFISALLIKRKELRMSAKQCLEHAWLTQRAESMSRVALPTDKLKKFIVRRKWQKTGNAIRALGRMAILSANSRRNLSASSSPTKTEFGDELFADMPTDDHGFKPIRPVVVVEDRTGSEYQGNIPGGEGTAEQEITNSKSKNYQPEETEMKEDPTSEVPIREDLTLEVPVREDSIPEVPVRGDSTPQVPVSKAPISEVQTPEVPMPEKVPIEETAIPEIEVASSDACSTDLQAEEVVLTEIEIEETTSEESELEEIEPVAIEEVDDRIQPKINADEIPSAEAVLTEEIYIEELSNDTASVGSDITTDLDAQDATTSSFVEETRKQSFSSFVNIEITEIGTIGASSGLSAEENVRIKELEENSEKNEEEVTKIEESVEKNGEEFMKEQNGEKDEETVMENEILASENIPENHGNEEEEKEKTSRTPVVTKAWCKTNNPNVVGDEEDEVARLAGRGRSRHIVRTGSVSRTAKMFEKEEESNSSPARQQNPLNRTTPMVPEGRPQNERIRKAFAFWNK